MICDNVIHCKDVSDELCSGECLKIHLTKPAIVKRCVEDPKVCLPIDKYCDAVPDCPQASDERDCTCEDWNMLPCLIRGKEVCLHKEWLSDTATDECQLDSYGSVTRSMISAINAVNITNNHGK